MEAKYKRHRETVNVVAAKHWEFMVRFLFPRWQRFWSEKKVDGASLLEATDCRCLYWTL